MTDAQLIAILAAARGRFWQGRAVKLALLAIVVVGVLAEGGLAELVWPGHSQSIGLWVLMGALGIWMLLSMTSAACQVPFHSCGVPSLIVTSAVRPRSVAGRGTIPR